MQLSLVSSCERRRKKFPICFKGRIENRNDITIQKTPAYVIREMSPDGPFLVGFTLENEGNGGGRVNNVVLVGGRSIVVVFIVFYVLILACFTCFTCLFTRIFTWHRPCILRIIHNPTTNSL